MSVLERILAIKLLNKQSRHPEYVDRLGVQIRMVKKETVHAEPNLPVLDSTAFTAQLERSDHDE